MYRLLFAAKVHKTLFYLRFDQLLRNGNSYNNVILEMEVFQTFMLRVVNICVKEFLIMLEIEV